MRAGSDGDRVLASTKLAGAPVAPMSEGCVEDFLDGRGEEARQVRKVKFKLADKRGALVDLGKHLGLFKERMEHTGKDGGPVEVKQVSDIEAARLIGRLLKKGADASPANADPTSPVPGGP